LKWINMANTDHIASFQEKNPKSVPLRGVQWLSPEETDQFFVLSRNHHSFR
jgi:hypothetical protein